MRVVSLLLLGTLATGCAPVEEAPRSEAEVRHLQQLTAGKAAAAAVDCVPSHDSQDMTVIDGRTIAFRANARRTYIAHLSQGCAALSHPGYALVTQQFGGSGLCRGDIARVADLSSQVTAGSCTIREVVPYNSPG